MSEPGEGSLVCLVTGAGKGIGRSTARALSERGHRVALAARNAEEPGCPVPRSSYPRT